MAACADITPDLLMLWLGGSRPVPRSAEQPPRKASGRWGQLLGPLSRNYNRDPIHRKFGGGGGGGGGGGDHAMFYS